MWGSKTRYWTGQTPAPKINVFEIPKNRGENQQIKAYHVNHHNSKENTYLFCLIQW